jgi:hypothetical protein
MGKQVALLLGQKMLPFCARFAKGKRGVAVRVAVYPVGPPSDLGQECSGQGAVGVRV